MSAQSLGQLAEKMKSRIECQRNGNQNPGNLPATKSPTIKATEEAVNQRIKEAYDRLIETLGEYSSECPMCHGLGAISLDFPITHEFFGKAWHCPCQYDAIAARRLAALGSFGIPEDHQHFDFASFDVFPAEVLETKAKAIRAGKSLVTHGHVRISTGVKKPWLTLSGLPGVGKSAIAAACAIAWRDAHKPVQWVDFNELMEDVQATYDKGYRGASQVEIIKAAQRAPVLILDDMGDEAAEGPISNDKRRITYAVIRHRHAYRLPTVITTNLDRNAFIRAFGRRIARRVFERGLWINLEGPDLTAY